MLNVQSRCGGESDPEYRVAGHKTERKVGKASLEYIGASAIGIRVVTARYLAEGKCLF